MKHFVRISLLAAVALVWTALPTLHTVEQPTAGVAKASGYGYGGYGWKKKKDKLFSLTILHNNDAESELLPSGDEGGVARFATLLKKERSKALRGRNSGVVFLSSGDNFLASPAFTASLADGFFYDARALDLLKYDAIAIGNHELDFGPDVLVDFISDFRCPGHPPYLSANLDYTNEPGLQALADDGIIAKSTIVWENGQRIGIIGATTENLPFITTPRDIIVNAVKPAVEAEIAKLKDKGINKIILISHLQDVDGDVALLAELTDIDVAIAGGGDELLANEDDLLLPSDDFDEDVFGPYPIIATDAEGNEVPVVTTSGQYGYLGKLEVKFNKKGEVVEFDGGPLRVVSTAFEDGVTEDRRMLRQVVEPVEEFVASLAANVIATSEVELNGIRGDFTAGTAGVRTAETNEGNLIADSQLWQAQQIAADFGADVPQVALQNGGGIRNDSVIPAGDITELDTFDMVPFANFITVVADIPRSQFKDILENAVARTDPDNDPTGGTGRFAQVAGFSFEYDASQPIGSRVSSVVLDDGTEIVDASGSVLAFQAGDSTDDIDIAIVDFLARGGDEYPFNDAPFTVLGVSYQQALANYIQAPTADGGLGGEITAAQYPEGGEGRIVDITP